MKYFLLILTLLTGIEHSSFAQKEIKYTNASALHITGKLRENAPGFHRLDTASYPALPTGIKHLLTNSAGIAVTFTTNSSTIWAKWCVSNAKTYENMTAIANKGLDLYVKRDGKWQFAGVGRPSALCSNYQITKNMEGGKKEFLLYLPLYDELTKLEIGVEEGSELLPGGEPFKKRILIYGSSIVQGASASRPGMAYPARLSRRTGLHFINFGLSGSAKMETPVADVVAELEADAYILDCVPNSSPEEITERTGYLVQSIRARHPQAPIILVQSIVREISFIDKQWTSRMKLQNENMRKQYEMLQKQGIKSLYFIGGEGLIGDDHEGTTDGTHPNDLGFDRMLQKMEPQIKAILSKHGVI